MTGSPLTTPPVTPPRLRPPPAPGTPVADAPAAPCPPATPSPPRGAGPRGRRRARTAGRRPAPGGRGDVLGAVGLRGDRRAHAARSRRADLRPLGVGDLGPRDRTPGPQHRLR